MKESGYNITLAALKALAHLPLGVLYLISGLISFVLGHVLHYRGKVILKNLHNSFPEKSEKEIRQIQHQYYKRLGEYMAETVKLLHISDRQINDMMTIVNAELPNRLLSEGRPIVMFLGHVGNWEYVPNLTKSITVPVEFGEIYRHLHSKTWNHIYNTLRSRFNALQILQEQAVRTIFRLNAKGPWMVGFLADQRPNTSRFFHWGTFMHQKTAMVTGAEDIGRRTGAAFVYTDIERLKRGRYQLTFKEIIPPADTTSDYPMTDQYFRMLEETIRRQPDLWLWSHNRWKFQESENNNTTIQ